MCYFYVFLEVQVMFSNKSPLCVFIKPCIDSALLLCLAGTIQSAWMGRLQLVWTTDGKYEPDAT